MVCKQSILTGIICIIISSLAVILKYKMLKNRQKYQRKANEAESKYNAIYVDFIQNIAAIKKLSISKFCNRKLTESSEKYLKDKTYVIVTHRPRLKESCNKHYVFENHMMKETVSV